MDSDGADADRVEPGGGVVWRLSCGRAGGMHPVKDAGAGFAQDRGVLPDDRAAEAARGWQRGTGAVTGLNDGPMGSAKPPAAYLDENGGNVPRPVALTRLNVMPRRK